MNERERLISVLRKEPADRRPFICPGGMMTMVVTELMEKIECYWPEAHIDAEKMAALTMAANRLAGIENLGVPFCMTVEAEAMGAEVDLGTKDIEPRVVAYAANSMADMDALSAIDVMSGRAKVCVDAVKILKQKAPDVPVIANLTGPVSLATSLVDPLVYYRALRKDKEAAHALTGRSTESLIAFGDAMLEAGADVLCIADPSATGEIIGREAFGEFVLPYLNEMLDHFRNVFDVPAIVHICGDVRSLGTALADISAEAISVDSVVGIKTLKELIGGKVTMGNISTRLLEKGEPDSVFKSGMNALVSGGVDILAPACGISPKTPIRNIRSLPKAIARTKPQAPCC
ncbi:MAG: MtaA/CmuA family methyltransferase [Actinobacteria bacterium]|nr:MtaA/CmuA family methyltransferase [Actinomycetota bacterium]